MDCKIQFGPISSGTTLRINSSKLHGSFNLSLFAIHLLADLKLDN